MWDGLVRMTVAWWGLQEVWADRWGSWECEGTVWLRLEELKRQLPTRAQAAFRAQSSGSMWTGLVQVCVLGVFSW